ncbi:MAG: LPS export ABC transporter ATP-binding protein [Betaproteobacteria bacterium TMED41]|nr:MAG: LPS export ABC transporter ATP-binding protein [Betaproteobacteria bacterium TMED41]|tara:strand:+ start:773 stop:1522 length:750 start_codon:yes stop_codon:yes gene_type:complete
MSLIDRFQAKGLQKSFQRKLVVKDVSIDVKSGEVVGLLGPNGAGKTTCFYMMLGLIQPDGGEIFLNNQCITDDPIHIRASKGLAYLPQEASIFKRMSVGDNITAILQLQIKKNGKKISQEEITLTRNKLLEDFQIKGIENNLGQTLSGGERRRVEIARALATNPRFLLLDEPFAGVDPIAVIEIQRVIRFLKSQKIGVLITDHNVRETLGICDRATIIHDGLVLSSGMPTEIVGNTEVRKAYLGEHFRM